jgi:site-specific recombinase XerD
MESAPLFDCAGRRRSPATLPGYHQGRPPRNKGLQYPPDPPTVEEIIAVMRAAGETPDGLRLRGLIVVLWRAGLRISEALALTESDLAGFCGQLRRTAVQSGVRRRFAPHQLRHAHAVEMSREGVPLVVIQRQLGHADLGITSTYLRGIDNTEIIHTVHERPAPMIPATNGLLTLS